MAASITDLQKITDPSDRLVAIDEARTTATAYLEELRELQRAAVGELRAQGLSYERIARQMNLSSTRVRQMLGGA